MIAQICFGPIQERSLQSDLIEWLGGSRSYLVVRIDLRRSHALICSRRLGSAAQFLLCVKRRNMCSRYQSPAAVERMEPSQVDLNESIYPRWHALNRFRRLCTTCNSDLCQELTQNKEVTSRTESTGAIELMGPRQTNPHSPIMWGAVKSPCQIALYLPLERRPRAI